MNKIDLAWGQSVCVRESFLECGSFPAFTMGYDDFKNINYTDHEGDRRILALAKNVIYRQLGLTYRNIIITNGATGALSIALRTYKERGHNTCFTLQPPNFPLYPVIIKSAGLKHASEGDFKALADSAVAIIDSPSNPKGFLLDKNCAFGIPIIWDAVYANNIYTNGMFDKITHDVLVGSFSKLTGFNGIRIGWVATNDDLLYDRMKLLVTAEYAGLSKVDSDLLVYLENKVYWDEFETIARYKLNWNREEWSKLTKYFGDFSVPESGMFYYGPIDSSCKKLLEKSGIIHMPGSACGTTDDYGRFNLGQNNNLIKKAVKEILKNDKS